MMTPATTDARGGGGGGHGGAMGGGHAHSGGAGAFQNTGPAVPGPATVHRFPFAAHHSVSPQQHMSFAHPLALHHSRAIGSHVATLGYGGIWLDNYAYAPTVIVAQPIITLQSSASTRASSVRTPSTAEQGILVVRGDTKTYVTFASAKPG